jgi:hypothetical protein
MHDTAAHLVDRVIPRVPVRQWVLSLPRWARFLLACDPQLVTRTLDIALRAIFAQQSLRARRAGALAQQAGAVTFVQHANDREGLAHLCGYGARPPFSQERLSALPDGRLAYRLKRPLGDGRQAVMLQPTEFLRRLATLVPPPRAHLVRYHGVFGPASHWRSQVIPPRPGKTPLTG